MPALSVFNRRWGISSDDFVFPQVTEGIVRLLWFVVMLCVYSLHSLPAGCAQGQHLQNYILVLLLVNSVVIVLCFVTAYVSSRGTIVAYNSRRNIPFLIYFRCPLIFFEFVWNIVGSIWASDDLSGCDTDMVVAVRFTVVAGWMLFLGLLTGIWMVFDPLGHLKHDEVRLNRQRAKSLWKMRLQCLCVCASADDNATSAFEDVAELLSDFFKDSDLVASDVWAGLLLLYTREYHVLQLGMRGTPEPGDAAPRWMSAARASRAMAFALGVYGWPYYVWDSCSPRRWWALAKKIRFCQGCRCDQVLVVKDNCCRCNSAAFLLQTGLRETDLFHVSFHNRICELPFVAAADPKTSTIVIAIRGSLSLRDLVTDLCTNDESLELDEDSDGSLAKNGGMGISGEGRRVHKGILKAAKYVLSMLAHHNVIEDLYTLYPEHELVITGHSLGAGVAAVVAMLLRRKFPAVRCFAFSPPGCVVSADCIRETREYICSVVVGEDFVPRLSYESIQRLKRDVVETIQNCDRPKYELLLKGCFKLLCGAHQRTTGAERDVEAPPDPGGGAVNTNPEQPLLRSRTPSTGYTAEHPPAPSQYDNETSECEPVEQRCTLYLPGRILHAIAHQYPRNTYSMSWSDCSRFQKIKLSSRMLVDHLPNVVDHHLKVITQQTNTPEALRF